MARSLQGLQRRGRRYVCSPPCFTEPRPQLNAPGGALAFSPTTLHLTGGVQILIVRRPFQPEPQRLPEPLEDAHLGDEIFHAGQVLPEITEATPGTPLPRTAISVAPKLERRAVIPPTLEQRTVPTSGSPM